MFYVDSVKGLREFLKTAIDKALKGKVTEYIAALESQKVDEIVYASYSPWVYERRKNNGGLGDPNNIQGSVVKPGVLEVVNTTPPNPSARDGATTDKNLPELVEYGHMSHGYTYDYPMSPVERYRYMGPRRFTHATIDALEKDDTLAAGMWAGLASQGIMCEIPEVRNG